MSEHIKQQLRIQMETFASKMAREVIGPMMPERWGFAFIAFDTTGMIPQLGGSAAGGTDENACIAYCSSGERSSVADAMRFLLDKWNNEGSAQ